MTKVALRKGECLGWYCRLQSNVITVVLGSDDTVTDADTYERGQLQVERKLPFDCQPYLRLPSISLQIYFGIQEIIPHAVLTLEVLGRSQGHTQSGICARTTGVLCAPKGTEWWRGRWVRI